MKGITKNNIDEWFFNYNQDLLSEQQKDQLMVFLYENPEFNEEFIIWANTKVEPDLDLIDLELEKSLLRKPPMPISNQEDLWAGGIAAISLIAVILYVAYTPFIRQNSSFDSTPVRDRQSMQQTIAAPREIKNAPKVIPNKGKEYLERFHDSTVQNTDSPEKTFHISPATEPITEDYTLKPIDSGIVDSMTVRHSITLLQPDTSISIRDSILKPEVEKKRSKRQKLVLKPTKEFNKDHSDF